MNNFNGIGRIANEIELRYTTEGTAIAEFVIAIDNYGDKTSFINVTCWRKLAENVAEYMEKGRQIGVSGELVQDKWENKQGEKRSKIKINARNIKFLGGNKQNGKQQNKNQQGGQSGGQEQEDEDIEVPF